MVMPSLVMTVLLLDHRDAAGVRRADDARAADQHRLHHLDPADEGLPGRLHPRRHLLGGRHLGGHRRWPRCALASASCAGRSARLRTRSSEPDGDRRHRRRAARPRPAPGAASRAPRRPAAAPPSCSLGALYCLLPVAWVLIASTKSGGELFSTFTFAPSTHLVGNIARPERLPGRPVLALDGQHRAVRGRRRAAVDLRLGAGRLRAGQVPFPGRTRVFNVLLAGVLVPGVILAIPQYLLLAKVGPDQHATGRCCCPASSARTASTWPASTPRRPSRTTCSRPPAWTAPATAGSSARSRCR